MQSWTDAAIEGLVSGAIAGAISAAVMMATGRRDSGSAVAPINAVSHWLWGKESAHNEAVDVRHTAAGAITHVLASMFWAGVHAKLRPQVREEAVVPAAIAGGVITSVAAAFVDYQVVPKRLTPGFEKQLSMPSMVLTYGAIAAGIALGTVAMRARGHHHGHC